MDIQPLDLAILKGYWWSPFTWFIYHRTSSLYSHGTVLLGKTMRINGQEGDQIESTEGGVKLSFFKKYEGRSPIILRYRRPLPWGQDDKMLAWLIKKIGCKYEYKSFLGYITGIKTDYLDDPNQFVCTELCSEMFTQNGVDLWGLLPPTYIYPSDLLQNHLFKEVV